MGGKVKSYKKQIEEAEEIAALNLAKYRKVAGALGDAEASADANEQAMAMRKAAPSLLPLVFKSSNLPEQNILTNTKTNYPESFSPAIKGTLYIRIYKIRTSTFKS